MGSSLMNRCRCVWLSFAKTPPADQVVDLPALMRRQSPVDDHAPAPLASTPPDPLRRPPPGRSGEPRLAPATRRLQENGDPAQDSGDGSPLLGLANQDLDRVEAAPRDRDPRHRPPLATAPGPRTLDQALRPAHRGPPARQRRDQGPRHANGRRQPALGRPANPRRAPQARPRRGRAHRLPADAEAALAAVADLANVSNQSCPGLGRDRFLHRSHRSAPRSLRPRLARPRAPRPPGGVVAQPGQASPPSTPLATPLLPSQALYPPFRPVLARKAEQPEDSDEPYLLRVSASPPVRRTRTHAKRVPTTFWRTTGNPFSFSARWISRTVGPLMCRSVS